MVARILNLARTRVFSFHLLLLSRRILQGVLGRSSFMRGRRATKGLHRRARLAVAHPKHPSLLSVFSAHLFDLLMARCLGRLPLCRGVWNWDRFACAAGEHGFV